VSGVAPMLARELCALGRYEEAAPLAELGRRVAAEEDVVAQVLWRQAEALVDAGRAVKPTRNDSPAKRSRSQSSRTASTTRATRSATSPTCSRPRDGPMRQRPCSNGGRALRAQAQPRDGAPGPRAARRASAGIASTSDPSRLPPHGHASVAAPRVPPRASARRSRAGAGAREDPSSAVGAPRAPAKPAGRKGRDPSRPIEFGSAERRRRRPSEPWAARPHWF
jgi:hypothetical protein